MDFRLPVSLLTGFLGSGKTTLLNSWLRSPDLSDAAVIVNEFGAVGIDHALIAASSDNTIELSTGCLCCTVSGDLVNTLRELLVRRERGEIKRFDQVIIETTGLADPAPVVQALMTFPVSQRYRLSRIFTTVDSINGASTLVQHLESVKQVAIADQIVLTKTDISTGKDTALVDEITSINAFASIHSSSLSRPIGLSEILAGDKGGSSCDEMFTKLMQSKPTISPGRGLFDGEPIRARSSRHTSDVSSFICRFDEPLHWEHVANWLDALVVCHGPDLLRVKGILNVVGRNQPVVVHAVQSLFHPPTELASWPDGSRVSTLVFITRKLTQEFVCEVFKTIQNRVPVSAAGPRIH